MTKNLDWSNEEDEEEELKMGFSIEGNLGSWDIAVRKAFCIPSIVERKQPTLNSNKIKNAPLTINKLTGGHFSRVLGFFSSRVGFYTLTDKRKGR